MFDHFVGPACKELKQAKNIPHVSGIPDAIYSRSSFGMDFKELHKLLNKVYSSVILSVFNGKKYLC